MLEFNGNGREFGGEQRAIDATLHNRSRAEALLSLFPVRETPSYLVSTNDIAPLPVVFSEPRAHERPFCPPRCPGDWQTGDGRALRGGLVEVVPLPQIASEVGKYLF